MKTAHLNPATNEHLVSVLTAETLELLVEIDRGLPGEPPGLDRAPGPQGELLLGLAEVRAEITRNARTKIVGGIAFE